MKKIMITWDGPYSLEEIETGEGLPKNEKELFKKGKGIYQIYGSHPIYGSNVLLYIGKTTKSFEKRIRQETHWWDNADRNNVQIYTGRLFSKELSEKKDVDWIDDISLAEQLLINTHMPAHNSSNINTLSRQEKTLKKLANVRVINWHYYRDLMPEVSGDILLDETDVYSDSYILSYKS